MDWMQTELENVVSIIKGRKPNLVSSIKSYETPCNYVTIEAFELGNAVQFASQENNSIFTDEADILIIWDGARFGMVGKSIGGILGSTLAHLKPNKFLDKNYLFYYLRYKIDYLRSNQRGAGIPHLDSQLLKKLPLPLPPLSEQRRIVEILDQADEIRKLRKQANEKAEKIIPALFYEMFGDIKSNPKNFRKVKMGDVLKVKSGYSLTSAMMDKDGIYPVYGGNGINGYHNQFMFEESKIVIGRVGAYCGNVFYSKPKSWITDNALYVSEKTSDLIDEFLVYQLKVLNLNRYAGRAGQPLISGNRIYPIEIIIPEKPLQDNFVRRLNNFENTFELRAKSYERINRLFDILLSKAFDGSLTASWRKAHMQELLKEMEEQKKYLEGKINV